MHEVLFRLSLWRIALRLVFLITSIAIGAVAGKAQRSTAFVSAENKSTSTGANLWAPFGLHTDDLAAMVKRRRRERAANLRKSEVQDGRG